VQGIFPSNVSPAPLFRLRFLPEVRFLASLFFTPFFTVHPKILRRASPPPLSGKRFLHSPSRLGVHGSDASCLFFSLVGFFT